MKGIHQLEPGSVLAISYNCKNLEVLSLSCGKFTGNEIVTLLVRFDPFTLLSPSYLILLMLNSCTKLKILKLYRAEIVNPAELVEGVTQLPDLEKFSIDKYDILSFLLLSFSLFLVYSNTHCLAGAASTMKTFSNC